MQYDVLKTSSISIWYNVVRTFSFFVLRNVLKAFTLRKLVKVETSSLRKSRLVRFVQYGISSFIIVEGLKVSSYYMCFVLCCESLYALHILNLSTLQTV